MVRRTFFIKNLVCISYDTKIAIRGQISKRGFIPCSSGTGIGNEVFEPGRALEQGAEGVFGLRNAEIDPARASGRARGLGNP